MKSKTTVMVVDDHAIVRQGCCLLLREAGLEVLAQAASGEEAVPLFLESRPDVVVMDLSMEGVGGMTALRRLLTHQEGVRVVIFTMHDEPSFAARALRLGAMGYVTKTSAPDDLLTAIRQVARGNTFLSHDIAQALALHHVDPTDDPLAVLSNREFDVFLLTVQGQGVADIAITLSLTRKSVSNYLLKIKHKLGVGSVADLVRLAITSGAVKQNVQPTRGDENDMR